MICRLAWTPLLYYINLVVVMVWKQVVRHRCIKVVQWKPSGEGRGGWVSREYKNYD